MEWSKIYSTIIAGLLISLTLLSGVSWYNNYKIKDNFQTSPGEWKFYYLQSSEFDRLVVEIDWIKAEKANASAVTLLSLRAGKYLDKPDGINIVFSNEIQQSETKFSYNTSEVERIETEHRDFKPDPVNNEISMYILYLNGWYRDGKGKLMKEVLGMSYHASSISVFRDTIWNGEPDEQAWIKEAAVLVHEMGHLLGLVNIGYTSATDHEHYTLLKQNDTFIREYDNHCNDTQCAMYPNIERQSNGTYFTDFCENCSKDLAALKNTFNGRLFMAVISWGLMIVGIIVTIVFIISTVLKKRKVNEK